MSGEKTERRYPLDAIPWPNSVCSGCCRIGTSIEPFRSCRCFEPFVTVHSAREYLRLLAKAHPLREPKLSREEASMPGWSKRRVSQ
jgi:hypothetical protein